MTAGNNGRGWSRARTGQRISSLRQLMVTYEGHSEPVATRPPDISIHGMFINTNRRFSEGAVLNLQFRLALSGAEIRSRCEVRYCLPGVGVGVEFIGISPDGVRAIEKEIELAGSQQLRSGPPKRK